MDNNNASVAVLEKQEVQHIPDRQKSLKAYAQTYSTGGWKYSFWREYFWLHKNVRKRFKLPKGSHILEVACGCGFHTNVLNKMGYNCVGIDLSPEGIQWAQTHHPKSEYHCCDIMGEVPVQKASFDAVFAKGFSHYHYNQHTPECFQTTQRMMEFLKPGGVFIMSIVTNLSGSKKPGEIWHNRIEDYEKHFASFGHKWTVDYYKGSVVCGIWRPE